MATADEPTLPTTAVHPECGATDAVDRGGERPPAGHVRPTLGAYELLATVRTWAGGALHEAWHPRLRRTVLLRALHDPSPDARAAFNRSAQALAHLNHPNVADVVLEVGPDGPTPYLVLETGFGTPLAGFGPRDRLGRQCEALYPNRRLGRAMLDAARGLAAVHRAGLRHGALRPDAVRAHPDGAVVLAGLGAGEAIDLPAADAADGRADDLFALGAAFYALVTGAAPAGPDPPPAKGVNPGVSRDLSDVLGRCLAADPGRRYATADALAADLERVLQTDVVLAPWGRRGLWMIELLAVMLVGIPALLATLVLANAFQIPVPRRVAVVDVLAALALPPFLYWSLAELVLGRTPLRRWQRFEVADRSGDPAPRRWRLARAGLKFGLVPGCGGGFAATFTAADTIGPGFIPLLLMWMLPPVVVWWAAAWTLSNLRFFRGELLTAEDNRQTAYVLPHDLLTGTRLVVRRPAELRPPPPPAVSAAETLGGPAVDRAGPYDLGPRFGAGGMGAVHRAWDPALRRPAAVKFLGDHLAHDDRARERFEREGRLAAQLSHPNVARVYAVGEADGRPYIAQELIDGETLRQRVADRGPLPVGEAWRFLLQAAEALRAADRLGVVHRDVKPDNMMVTPQGVLKVTDFGLARQVEGEVPVTGAGGAVGTPAYMAPEQARGQPVDRRADMYSLGLSLYFLLTGRAAYPAQNALDRLALQLAGPPPSLVGLVPGLTDAQGAVLDRLLAPRREDRFDDYDALIEALQTESPDRTPAAPLAARLENGGQHLICCGVVGAAVFAAARWGLPAVLPDGWVEPFAGVTPLSPGVLLAAQVAVTLLTVWVFVRRPGPYPFRPRGDRSPGELGRIAVNLLSFVALTLLFGWPASHRTSGLRGDRAGRAATPPRPGGGAVRGHLPAAAAVGVAGVAARAVG